jgi:hypothetical protein
MISSPSAPSDAVTLYATDGGTVVEQDDGSIMISFDAMDLPIQPDDLSRLHDATRALSSDVRRCGSGCRWQLRVPGMDHRSVLVLSSEEVLALDELVGGAAAMYELNDILQGLDILTDAG